MRRGTDWQGRVVASPGVDVLVVKPFLCRFVTSSSVTIIIATFAQHVCLCHIHIDILLIIEEFHNGELIRGRLRFNDFFQRAVELCNIADLLFLLLLIYYILLLLYMFK